MVHSIELVFDSDTEAAIRRIWAGLAAAGIPSQAPASELLALHAEVHRLCGPHLAPAPMANSLPGQWTAHVTLARRVGGHQLGRALRIAGRPSRIDGRFAGLRRWDGNTRAEYLLG